MCAKLKRSRVQRQGVKCCIRSGMRKEERVGSVSMFHTAPKRFRPMVPLMWVDRPPLCPRRLDAAFSLDAESDAKDVGHVDPLVFSAVENG